MGIIFAAIVGIILWIPTMFIFSGAGGWGTAIDSAQTVMAVIPLIFVALPPFVKAMEKNQGTKIVWIIALSALLSMSGEISFIVADLLIFRNKYHPYHEIVSAFAASVFWAALGGVLYFRPNSKNGK